MAEYTAVELGDFSRTSNNLPVTNTNKLRNRFAKWKNWRRNHPYEEILDEEANKEINSEQWQSETYQEHPPLDEGFEEVELDDFAPEIDTLTEGVAETSIDLGLDTTPLLEGAAVGTTTLGAGTASTAATTAGTFLLGGGAAVVGGIATKIFDNGRSGKGYVLPNSEYIGPGNPIPISATRNSADQAAKVHDAGYRDINPNKDHHEQIKKLDKEAIKAFDEAYEKDGHINAKIGSIGLGVKRKVEDTLGFALYPPKPKSKCINYLLINVSVSHSRMPRALGPPPYERPNWERMNEGQRRYAMEQWQLARVRRGLNIDHPIPEVYQPEVEPVSSPELFDDVSFNEDDLFGPSPDQSPLFSSGGSPFRADIPDIPDSEDDYPPNAQATPNMSQGSATAMETESSGRANPDSSQDAGSSNKKQKTGRNRLPGTAGGQGGGGEASPGLVGSIPRPIQGTHISTRYYKKVHRFLTFGLAYKPIAVTSGTPPATHTDIFMVTPLAKIPWEYLFMYMNKSEFSLMPWGANVEKIKCTVRSENVRIAFPTNSSSSELATLNQNKFLRIAKGLAQNVNGLDIKPKTFSDTQPMIVTAVTPISKDDDLKEIEQAMYGVDPNAIGFTTQTPVHQFGIPYALPYYYSLTNQQDANKGGWPCLQSYIEEFEADGASGANICVMEYEPKCGLIKSMQPAIYSGYPSNKTADLKVNIGTGAGSTKARSTALTVNKDNGTWKILNETNFSRAPSTVNEGDNDTVELVEKCQYINPGLFPDNFIPSSCPTLHVGLQPVPALTSKVIGNDAALNSYTDSQAYFEVTCEAWVKCSYPTERPLYTASNIKLSDLLWTSGDAGKDLNIGKTMVHGLYQQ